MPNSQFGKPRQYVAQPCEIANYQPTNKCRILNPSQPQHFRKREGRSRRSIVPLPNFDSQLV